MHPASDPRSFEGGSCRKRGLQGAGQEAQPARGGVTNDVCPTQTIDHDATIQAEAERFTVLGEIQRVPAQSRMGYTRRYCLLSSMSSCRVCVFTTQALARTRRSFLSYPLFG